MNATLFGSHRVRIDPRSIELDGGSWRKRKADGSPFAWDLEVVEFFYKKTRRSSRPVVLDIGASTGSFCLLPTINACMKVHAFEPSPLPLEILRNNIALNRLQSRVTVHPYALSDKNGIALLKVPKTRQGGMACLGTLAFFSEWEEVEVETRRLDDLNLGRVHFLKIDVEGHELFVLRGGEKMIRGQRPGIMMEYKNEAAQQSGYKAYETLGLLLDWGYSRFHRVGRNDIWCE